MLFNPYIFIHSQFFSFQSKHLCMSCRVCCMFFAVIAFGFVFQISSICRLAVCFVGLPLRLLFLILYYFFIRPLMTTTTFFHFQIHYVQVSFCRRLVPDSDFHWLSCWLLLLWMVRSPLSAGSLLPGMFWYNELSAQSNAVSVILHKEYVGRQRTLWIAGILQNEEQQRRANTIKMFLLLAFHLVHNYQLLHFFLLYILLYFNFIFQ